MTTVQKSIAAITLLVEFLVVVFRPVWRVAGLDDAEMRIVKEGDAFAARQIRKLHGEHISFAPPFEDFPMFGDGSILFHSNELVAGFMIAVGIVGGLAVFLAPHIRREIAPTATEESVTSE